MIGIIPPNNIEYDTARNSSLEVLCGYRQSNLEYTDQAKF